MAFEKGGVCGALAKTFANLNGMVGVPSFVVGQPGHAATLTYELRQDASGKMVPTYRVQNDVSGFGRSRNADVAHWMGDWGRTSTYDFRGGYALYAQEALADAEAYRRSYEARLVAASFDGDAAAQEEAMNAARAAQAINYDAICGQVDLMVKRGAVAEEWAAFASGLAGDLKFHPLPMHDLIKEINRRTENKHLVALDAIRMDALQKATQVTKEQTVNRDACVSIAHALMGRSDGAVALFSYDGEHGGKIRLGEHLRGGGVAWKYSLDGGSSWTQLTAGETEVQLTGDQLESITAENDIKIQLIGANVVNSIDISKRELGRIMIEGNDRANRIYFQDGKVVEGLQMRVDGGTWEPFDIGRTYKGNLTVEVRRPATGMSAASEAVTFSFTAGERDASFVPYEEMAVNSYSSSRDGAAMANRVIDGYYGPGNEFWITKTESSPDAWIVIDLGHEREISSLTYWRPKGINTNGIPRWGKNMRATVLAAPDMGLPTGEPVDAAQFTEVEGYSWRGGTDTIERIDALASESGCSFFQACELACAETGRFTAKARRALCDFVRIVREGRRMDGELQRVVESIVDMTGLIQALSAEGTVEAESRVENIREFLGVAAEFEETHDDIEGTLESLAELRAAGVAETGEDAANEGSGAAPRDQDETERVYGPLACKALPALLEWLALRSDLDSLAGGTHAVTMMTVHSAKGLEFPAVFVAGLEEGIFPHVAGFSDDPAKLEEERRLAYVAITRARKRLFITYAATRRSFGTTQANPRSRFVGEIPEEDIEFSGVGSAGFEGTGWEKRGDRRGTFGSGQGSSMYGGRVFGSYTRSTPGTSRHTAISPDAGRAPSTFGSGSAHRDSAGASAHVVERRRPDAARAAESFEAGDRVSHKTFGQGTVIGVSGDMIEVTFDKSGQTKKLMKGFAPIVKIV